MFEQALRSWLETQGLSQNECDLVCSDLRVAFSLNLQDEGGMLSDLPRGLYKLPPPRAQQALMALSNAGAQLSLMMLLRSQKDPPPLKRPRVMRMLCLSVCAEGENNWGWTASSGKRSFGLSNEQVKSLAAMGTVEKVVLQLPPPPKLPKVKLSYTADTVELQRWLTEEFAFTGIFPWNTAVGVGEPESNAVAKVFLQLSTDAYVAFFEAQGVIS